MVSVPQQLLLDFGHEAALPTLDNFVIGKNLEAVARLCTLGDPAVFDQIYLWGTPNCGRTHLLSGARAVAEARGRPVVFVPAREIGPELATPPGCLIIVDDVETLDPIAQITLFRIFNTARLVGLALLLAGSAPPMQLADHLREDLRTRIGAALIYEVHPLGDEEKLELLRQHAHQNGLRVPDDLFAWLLQHSRRDLPSLLATFDRAAQAALESRRPLTLTLLRKILEEREHIPDALSPAAVANHGDIALPSAHEQDDNHETGPV